MYHLCCTKTYGFGGNLAGVINHANSATVCNTCRNARKREVYSVSCIGVLPFIEVLSETVQSGLVASGRDSEEHA